MSALRGYEVLVGVFGVLAEGRAGQGFHLGDRANLYGCVRHLVAEAPDKVFSFAFSDRSGVLISEDVDICLRNLEDSKRLKCANPDLVDFESTPLLVADYAEAVKPKLDQLGLMQLFLTATNLHFPPTRTVVA